MKDKIANQWTLLNIAEKIIAINVVLYILSALLPFLGGSNSEAVLQWVELPKDFFQFLGKPWTLITYAFFHGSLLHLFFNMLMLYFVGRMFLNLFALKRFINVYFLGIISGGLLFLLAYNLFPAFIAVNAVLVGASAGVMAILIFVCTYMPNQEVRLLMFNIKLWYIGAALVLIDIIQIPISNSGGHIAHIGGAILGYFYASQITKGNDIGAGFEKLIASIMGLFKKKEKSHLKTVYKKSKQTENTTYSKNARQKKVDTILDKIGKSGYSSLTQSEKDFLINSGKNS